MDPAIRIFRILTFLQSARLFLASRRSGTPKRSDCNEQQVNGVAMVTAHPTFAGQPQLKAGRRYGWHAMVALVQSHWRGELCVWQVFVYCPSLVFAPLVLIGVASIAPSAIAPTWDWKVGPVFLGLLVTHTVLAALWWCWGAIQTSMRLLSENRLVAPAAIFLMAIMAAWEVTTDWVPEIFSSTLDSIADARKQRVERALANPAWHYRPWIVIAQPALRRFIASGPIGDGSARVLADAIKAHPGLRLLELDSPGGLFDEAEQVVTLVRKHKLDTVVLDKCASACTSIFLAGERRYITWNARFGFHQSGYYGRKHDTVWATEEYETAIYFRERGVSEAFLQTALNTSHYGIWRPDPLDVKRNGFANAWWIERPGEYR